ncbi:MAG TPA: methylmalonyl-CoA mutase family protein, partial [Ktedonobacterales bacterium]|nr:methylmalonyl-CoA mutase family protein [Ktedonobacterales bacterium]
MMLDQKASVEKIDAASALYDKSELNRVVEALSEWEEGPVRKANARMPERRTDFTTQSGIPVKRLYTPLDVAHQDYLRDIGLPGEYPYTRGVQPTMYRGKPWTMRMFAGFGTAEETNQRFKYLLEHGQTGLSVAFDMPT